MQKSGGKNVLEEVVAAGKGTTVGTSFGFQPSQRSRRRRSRLDTSKEKFTYDVGKKILKI